ncbi:helix-turn-helix domain-containing protein [Gymnodinialimonas hymeniacidonis]|uniref:helix-turn-helix domain-containing protein n=1 Tax=Gymnodinialimonas hymeniacidonis TaxID=3126508 RepID=UPI0034C6A1DF
MAAEIIVRLDVMLALRKMKSRELAAQIGITEANLSLLKSGKVKGIRFETLAKICEVLDCQPGDLLEAVPTPPLGDQSPPEREQFDRH